MLCCALRHLMKYDAEYLPSSVLQAFVDLVSTKSEELMGIMVESLVSTDFHHAQTRSSASGGLLLFTRWSHTAYRVIRRESRTKPSSEHISLILINLMIVRQSDLFLNRCHHGTNFSNHVVYSAEETRLTNCRSPNCQPRQQPSPVSEPVPHRNLPLHDYIRTTRLGGAGPSSGGDDS